MADASLDGDDVSDDVSATITKKYVVAGASPASAKAVEVGELIVAYGPPDVVAILTS